MFGIRHREFTVYLWPNVHRRNGAYLIFARPFGLRRHSWEERETRRFKRLPCDQTIGRYLQINETLLLLHTQRAVVCLCMRAAETEQKKQQLFCFIEQLFLQYSCFVASWEVFFSPHHIPTLLQLYLITKPVC